jgi:hypothetical protein
MAQSVASLKNLQALRLLSNKSEYEARAPLAKIKNLKHLSVEDGFSDKNGVIQSIVLNSASTLRSLAVTTDPYTTGCFQDWEKMVSANDPLSREKHSLTVLKYLSLCGMSFDTAFIKSLQKAVDFMGLRELTLGHLADGKHILFQHLTTLTTSSATGICLRSLSLDMSESWYGETPEQVQTTLAAICYFISSFDTLTTLEIKNFNQYPDTIPVNPGLPHALLQAILKHKNLKTLKISYAGMMGGRRIPFLSAKTVSAIIDNLPHLQDFEFAPQEAEIVRTFLYSASKISPIY